MIELLKEIGIVAKNRDLCKKALYYSILYDRRKNKDFWQQKLSNIESHLELLQKELDNWLK